MSTAPARAARRTTGAITAALLIAGLGAVTTAHAAAPDRGEGAFRRVDNRPDGAAPVRGAFAPAISKDGRYSTFAAGRDVVGGNPANRDTQVYRHDAVTGTTTLVSRSVRGRFGNDTSYLPSISDDGRYVVFTSSATNLPGADPAVGGQHVYRFDARTGRLQLISHPLAGSRPSQSTQGQISGNGRFVAFASDVPLTAADTNERPDVYRWDARTGATVLISTTSSGGSAAGNSFGASASDDGHVAYLSDATDLTPGAPSASDETPAYVWDPRTSENTLVSTTRAGAPVSPIDFPKISDNARYVTYYALVSPENRLHLYSYAVRTGTLDEITAPTGAPRDVYGGAMSADGRRVLITYSDGIVGSPGYRQTVAIVDRGDDRFRTVTQRPDVTAFDLSADGRHVGFLSAATDLTDDPDTNGTDDAFVWSRR